MNWGVKLSSVLTRISELKGALSQIENTDDSVFVQNVSNQLGLITTSSRPNLMNQIEAQIEILEEQIASITKKATATPTSATLTSPPKIPLILILAALGVGGIILFSRKRK